MTESQNPLTAEQIADVRAASVRGRKVRRACAVAKFDAWATAIFAGFTLACAALSPWALLVGLPMAAIAWNSFMGLKLLEAYDLRGPRRLGANQILLMALIFAYCIWQIVAIFTLGSITTLYPQLEQLGPTYGIDTSNLDTVVRVLVVVVYGAVMVASFLTQGGMALYYFTRARHVRAYLDKTPDWVLELHRLVTG